MLPKLTTKLIGGRKKPHTCQSRSQTLWRLGTRKSVCANRNIYLVRECRAVQANSQATEDSSLATCGMADWKDTKGLIRAVLFCAVLLMPLVSGQSLSAAAGPAEAQCGGKITSVRVSPDSGEDCSGHRGSLSNRTCSDLQDVLLSIAGYRTRANDGGCIQVNVFPGAYLIDTSVSIDTQSLILHGYGNVSVSFNFSGQFDPRSTFEAYYVLRLANMTYAEFFGIHFHNSPGIIGFDNISTTVITDCTFRLVRSACMFTSDAMCACASVCHYS